MKKNIAITMLLIAAVAAAAQAPAPPAIYGTGWQAFSQGLENLEIGKGGRQLDIRFRAENNAALQSAVVFMKTGSGYSAGTGGLVRISLEADDGTPNHLPSGSELDFSQAAPGNPSSPTFREFVFTNHVTLTAGNLYHLVFTNPDPAASSNYVSLNNLSNSGGTAYPFYSFADFAMVWKSGGNSDWAFKPDTCPIVSIKYANGLSQGQGYIDALASSGLFQIQDGSQAGETFTVSGGSRTVNDVRVHVKKTGTPGDLTVTLQTTGGTVIEQGVIPASSIGTDYAWEIFRFGSSHVLANGSSYLLSLSTSGGSGSYQVFPLDKGISRGLDVPSEFHDGHYQTNTGSGWANFKGGSGYDLQLYFSTDGASASAPAPPTGLTAAVQ